MVLQKLESALLTITMNRPDRRNALNPDMTRGLVEAARRAAEDHEVRAVLLKGAGVETVWPEMLALCLTAAFLIGFSAWRFRRQLA